MVADNIHANTYVTYKEKHSRTAESGCYLLLYMTLAEMYSNTRPLGRVPSPQGGSGLGYKLKLC